MRVLILLALLGLALARPRILRSAEDEGAGEEPAEVELSFDEQAVKTIIDTLKEISNDDKGVLAKVIDAVLDVPPPNINEDEVTENDERFLIALQGLIERAKELASEDGEPVDWDGFETILRQFFELLRGHGAQDEDIQKYVDRLEELKDQFGPGAERKRRYASDLIKSSVFWPVTVAP